MKTFRAISLFTFLIAAFGIFTGCSSDSDEPASDSNMSKSIIQVKKGKKLLLSGITTQGYGSTTFKYNDEYMPTYFNLTKIDYSDNSYFYIVFDPKEMEGHFTFNDKGYISTTNETFYTDWVDSLEIINNKLNLVYDNDNRLKEVQRENLITISFADGRDTYTKKTYSVFKYNWNEDLLISVDKIYEETDKKSGQTKQITLRRYDFEYNNDIDNIYNQCTESFSACFDGSSLLNEMSLFGFVGKAPSKFITRKKDYSYDYTDATNPTIKNVCISKYSYQFNDDGSVKSQKNKYFEVIDGIEEYSETLTDAYNYIEL